MDCFDNEDVCDLFDIVMQAKDTGTDPDWAAVASRIWRSETPPYLLILLILQVCWLVYEDDQAALSRLYKEKHGL